MFCLKERWVIWRPKNTLVIISIRLKESPFLLLLQSRMLSILLKVKSKYYGCVIMKVIYICFGRHWLLIWKQNLLLSGILDDLISSGTPLDVMPALKLAVCGIGHFIPLFYCSLKNKKKHLLLIIIDCQSKRHANVLWLIKQGQQEYHGFFALFKEYQAGIPPT